MKNIFSLNNSFQPYPIEAPVESDGTAEIVNRTYDKLITELSGILLRVQGLQKMTAYHGPAIDAAAFVSKAIQRLQRQKR